MKPAAMVSNRGGLVNRRMPQPLLDPRRGCILFADNRLPGFEVVPRSPTANPGEIVLQLRDLD